MIIDAIFSGVLVGIIIALVALGPSFFTLLRLGIHNELSVGMLFAFGIFLSDVVIVLLMYLGLSNLVETPLFHKIFSLTGGVLVLVFGVNSLRTTPKAKAYCIANNTSKLQYIVEGFGLNILNPATFALWLVVIASLKQMKSYSNNEMFVFYGVVLLTIFGTDLLKVFLAHQTRKSVSTRFLNRLNHGIGIILILFSVKLLYSFFTT